MRSYRRFQYIHHLPPRQNARLQRAVFLIKFFLMSKIGATIEVMHRVPLSRPAVRIIGRPLTGCFEIGRKAPGENRRDECTVVFLFFRPVTRHPSHPLCEWSLTRPHRRSQSKEGPSTAGRRRKAADNQGVRRGLPWQHFETEGDRHAHQTD